MDLRLRVKDLDCVDCARALEHVARRIEGVEEAKANSTFSTLELTLSSNADRRAVLRALRRKGYETVLLEEAPARRGLSLKEAVSARRVLLTLICGALLLAALVLWLGQAPRPAVKVALILASAAGLPLTLLKAINALRSRSIDMNVLMSVAIVAGAAIGEWEEAASVAFLFSVATILEAVAMARTRRAIESLMDASPDQATVRRDGGEATVEADVVRPGETIVVRPGERIPLEGRIVSGSTSVDQSLITGEPMPVEKTAGATVFAGTLNEEGLIQVEVTKPREQSTLARIVHLVEHVEEAKAPVERFVDRFASIYTPAVVGGAIVLAAVPSLLGLKGDWIYRSLVLLIIACPCALVIATPVAVVSGLTSAARKGILIKGGVHLEQAARVSAVALDKTGTLTVGRPVVSNLKASTGLTEERLLKVAASVESGSNHPLASVILAEARRRGIHWEEAGEVRSITGSGMSGLLGGETYFVAKPDYFLTRFGLGECLSDRPGTTTVVAVGTEKGIIGTIEFADEIRPGAAETVGALRRLGIKRTVLVTGDREETAREIAAAAGLDAFHANLLPEDKVRVVEDLKRDAGNVAMVGDGVNDAPALAAAQVGVAMGSAGSDTAIDTADVALMSDDIRNLVPLFTIAKRVASIVKQNIGVALAIKAIFLVLAASGRATMWLAVFADMGASLLVTANALRMLSDRAARLKET